MAFDTEAATMAFDTVALRGGTFNRNEHLKRNSDVHCWNQKKLNYVKFLMCSLNNTCRIRLAAAGSVVVFCFG